MKIGKNKPADWGEALLTWSKLDFISGFTCVLQRGFDA